MYSLDFIYENNKINKNKLKKEWVEKHRPDIYIDVTIFEKTLNFNCEIFSQLLYHYNNIMLQYPLCEYCNFDNKRFQSFEHGYKNGCSRHCAILLSRPQGIETRIKNTMKKYGVEHTTQRKEVLDKMKSTNMERFGVEHPTQNSEILDKMKKTNIERYGVELPLQNEDIKNKTVNNFIEKYGVDNPMKIKEVIDKIRNNSIDKYGVSWPTLHPGVRDKIENSNLDRWGVTSNFLLSDFVKKSKVVKIVKYGKNYQSEQIKNGKRKILLDYYKKKYSDSFVKYDQDNHELTMHCNICECDYVINPNFLSQRNRLKLNICLICNPIGNKVTKGHKEILDFLDINNIKYEVNNRIVLNGLELDIFLPDYKIGIEYNGIYWHSELHKKIDYHIIKYNKCKDAGIELIQIWEDTWNNKKEIIKSIIKNRLQLSSNIIGARKCIIKEVSSANVRQFLEQNHLQGYSNANYKYGLFLEDELVCIATFNKGRLNVKGKNDEYEIVRLANKLNYKIVGGFKRLFKHFLNVVGNCRIISYSDNDYFNGNIYKNLGLSLENDIIPSYTWCDGEYRYNRWNFRKDKLVREGYDKKLTEVEIMNQRGWVRCFSSGNKKWAGIFLKK